jgi:hypothetical protein
MPKKKPEREEDPLIQGPDGWSNVFVLYCGHAGMFMADVIVTPFAVTIIAPKEVKPDTLVRKDLSTASFHISDINGGYWNPRRGRFVLPRESVTVVTPDNFHRFV